MTLIANCNAYGADGVCTGCSGGKDVKDKKGGGKICTTAITDCT